jgi:N-acetylmuramoyl-L-alanine amidase
MNRGQKGAMSMKLKKLRKFIPMIALLSLVLTLGGYVLAQTYYVQPGDSLYRIATRYGASINDLQRLNQLENLNLYPGQALQIGATGGNNQSNYHTVSPGDSLYLIAQRYNISVAALKKSNNLSGNSLLNGQRLTIPAAVGAPALTVNYTVKAGDTPYLIAQRNKISPNALLSLNRLNSSAVLQPGQTIQLPTASVSRSASPSPSRSDLDLLARLVSAESAGEPFEGQVAVAATILNRLKDKRYPKTIPGIIYQINYGCYQYSPVLDGRINEPTTTSAYRAVQMALSGWDPSNGANGFYNPTKTNSQWVRSHPMTATIGEHVFFNY